ncbi:serine aminopeptidase domain-containing protein [Actinoplanes sp. TFC3]|uniref:alpha/beta hydrolase family protein n=1 Tax=Actinoplanes sp. TFC3 TaxID=1710355 RepID=UPI000836B9CD|nr:alpha/beta hydrolase [Actinoplanes sp. TFC3]
MTTLTRRHLLAATLAAGTSIALSGKAFAAPGTPRLTLPRPTGAHPVGTAAFTLTRDDRLLPAHIWYPARDTARHPRSLWMLPEVLTVLLADAGFPADAVLPAYTSGHRNAPVRRGAHPVIFYSHGAHSHRADTTIMVQELASHGYVVITVDHTGDAYTELPGGRVLSPSPESLGSLDFADDLSHVIDTVLSRSGVLPAGLGHALDTRRVGVAGWSKGGTAAAWAMSRDPRVRAGLSLDAPMIPVITAPLQRPFLMLTAENPRDVVPEFWEQLRGWRREVHAEGAVHTSYMDYQWFYPQLAPVVGLSEKDLAELIGALDPGLAVRIQQAFPVAFFDLHLRHRRGHLLDGPSPAFPKVAVTG